MNDSKHRRGQPTSFSVPDLTERLLRRAREPVGVIDLGQVEQLQARTPIWLRQRLEFLDNFRVTYGLDEGTSVTSSIAPPQAADRTPFVGAYPTRAGNEASFPPPPQSSIMRKALPPAASGAVSEAAATLALRVKRPQVILEASGAMEYASQELPRDESKARLPAAGSSSHLLSQVGEIRAKGGDSLGLPLRRKAIEAAIPTSATSKPERSGTSPTAHSLPGPTELAGNKASAHNVHPQSRIETGNLLGSTSFIRPSETLVQNLAGGNETSPAEIRSPRQVKEMPGENDSSHNEMTLQRKYDLMRGSAEIAAVRNGELRTRASSFSSQKYPEPTPAEADSHSAALSQEIGVAAPGAATMVWRKPNSNGSEASPTTVSTGTQFLAAPGHSDSVRLMRQVASDSHVSASASSPSNALPKMVHTSENGATDIVQIAERVSRVIARQLAIERERRGKTR